MTDQADPTAPTDELRRVIARHDSGLLPNDVLEQLARGIVAAGWRRP